MAMSLYLLLALILALAAGLWWSQHRQTRRNNLPEPKPREHHGVMIVAGPHACSAVSQFSGRRLLASEAPLLPLPSCDSEQCQCVYHHLKDRRQSQDRRHINVDIDEHHKLHENRQGGDRRNHSLR